MTIPWHNDENDLSQPDERGPMQFVGPTTTAELVIPGDLHGCYALCADDPCAKDFDNSVVRSLIERIARLALAAAQQENAALKARCERMSAPVTHDEAARYSRHVDGRLVMLLRDVDALLAARQDGL